MIYVALIHNLTTILPLQLLITVLVISPLLLELVTIQKAAINLLHSNSIYVHTHQHIALINFRR